MRQIIVGITFVLLLLPLTGCQPTDPVETAGKIDNQQSEAPAGEPAMDLADAAENPWIDFVNRYVEDYMAAHPAWAVTKGRHEFDGL